MATEPTASIRLVWPFAKISMSRRPVRSVAWERNAIDRRLSDADARLPHSVLNDLLAAAAAHVNLPDFGLLAAEEVMPGDLDLFELAARSRATLGGALSCMARLLPLLHDAAEITLVEQDGLIDVRFGFERGVELHPVGYDFLLALALISVRRVTAQPGFQISAALFPFPARDELSVYRRIFRCDLRFDQPHAGLRIDRAALEVPLVYASPAVSAALERVATELIAAGHAPDDFRARFASAISEELSSGRKCTTATISKRLGMSLRTLQRRLSEEGTSFRTSLDDHRYRLARAYLSRPELSLTEISYLLGFATTQAFHKAFKRWSDQTPVEYRNRAASQR